MFPEEGVNVEVVPRNTWYFATPTLSVDAAQVRATWLPLAVAVNVAGMVGFALSKWMKPCG
jgi:hypothetical protein